MSKFGSGHQKTHFSENGIFQKWQKTWSSPSHFFEKVDFVWFRRGPPYPHFLGYPSMIKPLKMTLFSWIFKNLKCATANRSVVKSCGPPVHVLKKCEKNMWFFTNPLRIESRPQKWPLFWPFLRNWNILLGQVKPQLDSQGNLTFCTRALFCRNILLENPLRIQFRPLKKLGFWWFLVVFALGGVGPQITLL